MVDKTLNEVLKLIIEKDEEMDKIEESVSSKIEEIDVAIARTKEVLDQAIEEAQQIKKGEDGLDGNDGIDGTDGVKGDKGDKGDPGYTPVRGTDYWTKEDQAKIQKDIEKLIPKIKEAKPIDVKGLVEETFAKYSVDYSKIKGAPDLTNLPELIKYLKAGGFRGGAGSNINNNAQTIVTNNYSAFITDDTIIGDGAVPITITLPSSVVGKKFNIKNLGVDILTVVASAGETIDGDPQKELFQWSDMQITCYALGKWIIL